MVKACLPSIRQTTATLINCHPDSLDITVQGHQNCVELAQRRIDMILQDFKANSSEKQDQCLYDVNSNHSPSVLIEANNSSFVKNSSNVYIQNHHVLSERPSNQTTSSIIPSPTKSDDSVFFSGEHNDRDVYDLSSFSNLINKELEIPAQYDITTSNQPPFQAYMDTKSYNGLLELDSDHDSISVDGRFSEHIGQARKLGFSEEQIWNVLRRLGVKASMEDMMHELVLNPTGQNQEDVSSQIDELDTDDLPFNEQDSDDSEGFDVNDSSNLRHIIIDGSNVAMSHGQKVFSCLGIKIVVDWFKHRGHKNITVFVPQWRKEASRPDAPITDQEILAELESERIVVFTPSRRIGGTRIVCYDDRYVLQLAVQKDGIVVSNDVYRDLVREREDFKEVVEKRLLMYSFVQDMFMPPEDPLGRQGPSLDNFLRIKPSEPKNKPQICPYGKKCTYGNKCRFYHPERRYAPQKMVADKLKESAEFKSKSIKVEKWTETALERGRRPKQKLSRTVSLVPQVVADEPKSDVIPGQTKKRQLLHSKSLVYPSSYLTDLRLKMEEAESAETLQQPTFETISLHHQVNPNMSHNPVIDKKDRNPTKKQCSNSPSPRTSPIPQNEFTKANIRATQSFPPSPVSTLASACPASDVNSSFNISNPEPQDRYLSGHVMVVKSLSDEDNSNGNFFSQHTSRALGSSQQGNQTSAYDGHLSSDPNLGFVLPTLEVSTSKQLADAEIQESSVWSGQNIFIPPEITSHVDYNEQARRPAKVVSPTNVFLPTEMKHSPTSTHSLITPASDQCDSCPPFSRKDENFDLPEKQQFKRSLSTSTSPSVEYQKPPSYSHRKYSFNANSPSVKPNFNAALNQRISYSQFPTNTPSMPPKLQRGKMSFDSGISSGGLSVDHQLNFPFSPTENFSSPFSSYTSNMPSPAIYSPTTGGPARFTMTQQEPMYNSSPSGLSSPSTPLPFSPVPNRMPSFQDQYRTQTHTPSSNLTNQTQHPAMFHQPPPYSPMTQFLACPPPSQQQAHPTYQHALINTDNRFYQTPLPNVCDPSVYNPNTPVSLFLQQPPSILPQSKMVDEEAAINVEDPRYSLYYNLSSVFGERAVRTFMNRNPDVRNFHELYSLIRSYKEDTGM